MISSFTHFLRDDTATAIIEYAVVMSVFAVSLIGVFQLFLSGSGTQLTGTQNNLASTAMVPPTPPAGT